MLSKYYNILCYIPSYQTKWLWYIFNRVWCFFSDGIFKYIFWNEYFAIKTYWSFCSCPPSIGRVNSSPPIVPHICVGELVKHRSSNGLSPVRCRAISWTNADLLSTGPLGTNEAYHSWKCIWKCHLPKWRPFCAGEDELRFQWVNTAHRVVINSNKFDISRYIEQVYLLKM